MWWRPTSRPASISRPGDKGANWERRNEFDAGAMYYARIVPDPKNVDRIFVMNVELRESTDGQLLRELPILCPRNLFPSHGGL